MFNRLNDKGRIPAHEVCPFKSICMIVASGNCHHKGTESDVDFSCAIARMFDITMRNERYAQLNEQLNQKEHETSKSVD